MGIVQNMANRIPSQRMELLSQSQRNSRKKIGLSLTYFDQLLYWSDAERSFCGQLFYRTSWVEVEEDDVGSNTTIEFFESFYLCHVSSMFPLFGSFY
jgi:hypothetical protein